MHTCVYICTFKGNLGSHYTFTMSRHRSKGWEAWVSTQSQKSDMFKGHFELEMLLWFLWNFLIVGRAGLINTIILNFFPKTMCKGYIEVFNMDVFILLYSLLILAVPLQAEWAWPQGGSWRAGGHAPAHGRCTSEQLSYDRGESPGTASHARKKYTGILGEQPTSLADASWSWGPS